MRKNLLCRLGLHKPEKYSYWKVTKQHYNGKRYHRNYVICERCGKRIATISKVKEKNYG